MKHEQRVAIVEKPCDVEETSRPFGKRWGQEIIALTARHILALQAGKHLAVDVRGEYVVFLRLEQGGTRKREKAKEARRG
jgi:hypothetical protein